MVLATDAVSSYVIFRYGEVQWTTGDKSGGSGGFGGSEAVVGFNAGDRINYVSVIGSGMPEIVDIETQTNVMMPGVFMTTLRSLLCHVSSFQYLKVFFFLVYKNYLLQFHCIHLERERAIKFFPQERIPTPESYLSLLQQYFMANLSTKSS